jgi:hypothetical protein
MQLADGDACIIKDEDNYHAIGIIGPRAVEHKKCYQLKEIAVVSFCLTFLLTNHSSLFCLGETGRGGSQVRGRR